MQTEQAVETVRSEAEKIKNNDTRNFDAWRPGDVAAQGDLNIVCVRTMPKSAKPRQNRQMADGETMGSRHIVTRGDCFDADAKELARLVKEATGKDVRDRYMGPLFTGPATLDHPEHGNHEYPLECVNVVVFQRVLDAEERERRVLD